MKCTVVLEFESDQLGDGQLKRVEVVSLYRDPNDPLQGDVGLNLEEGQTLQRSIQQRFITEQIEQFYGCRRQCRVCDRTRRVHDRRRSTVATVLGTGFYVRERWKACSCGADASRYLSPLKDYLPTPTTPELQQLHATLGAMLPYRQAHSVMQLLLPMDGRHNHVTIRNHMLRVGKQIESDDRLKLPFQDIQPRAELGIDVGHIRQIKGRGADTISVVAAALGAVGKSPRVWASTRSKTKPLHDEMMKFLKDGGYDEATPVHVLTDAAMDLKKISKALPNSSRWILDWAHIGRLLQHLDRTLGPFAYGRVSYDGSPFELWDLFIRFRHYVWTGQKAKWKEAGDKLFRLFLLREQCEFEFDEGRSLRLPLSKLMAVLNNLDANDRSLIDYHRWQQAGLRISTSFVESTINRLIGRRMCRGQQMRWSKRGAHCLLQVRAALLNKELNARMQRWYPWIGTRRVSWPWQTASQPF